MLLVRGHDGAIRLLRNRCTHRGTELCQAPSGNANAFRCHYHGWTFHNTGELVGVSFPDGYPGGTAKHGRDLWSAPRLDSYRGFVFASLQPDVSSLREHLGPATDYIDGYVDHAGGRELCVDACAHTSRYQGNWKLQVENGVDGYHANFTHSSFFALMQRRTGRQSRYIVQEEGGCTRDLGHGHVVLDQSEVAGEVLSRRLATLPGFDGLSAERLGWPHHNRPEPTPQPPGRGTTMAVPTEELKLEIVNAATGKTLGTKAAPSADGTLVVRDFPDGGPKPEQWQFTPVQSAQGGQAQADQAYVIRNAANGKVLDDPAAADRGVRQSDAAAGKKSQQWHIVPTEGEAGLYFIKGATDGAVLDLAEPGEDDTRIVLREHDDSAKSQRWRFVTAEPERTSDLVLRWAPPSHWNGRRSWRLARSTALRPTPDATPSFSDMLLVLKRFGSDQDAGGWKSDGVNRPLSGQPGWWAGLGDRFLADTTGTGRKDIVGLKPAMGAVTSSSRGDGTFDDDERVLQPASSASPADPRGHHGRRQTRRCRAVRRRCPGVLPGGGRDVHARGRQAGPQNVRTRQGGRWVACRQASPLPRRHHQ